MVALGRIAPACSEPLQRRLVLDALGDDLQAEAVGKRDRRLDDDGVGPLALHPHHEPAVDLEHVDREPPEMGERGVTDSEVVDRDPHAESIEPLQDDRRAGAVGEDRALGDLELEARRIDAVLGKRCSRPRPGIACRRDPGRRR